MQNYSVFILICRTIHDIRNNKLCSKYASETVNYLNLEGVMNMSRV